ncbi:MAG TPA: response regulator transcription factor [Candidatus Binatia bacterium]|nr:response regulator transcription factor [Candidatus Binatia bacterium]
MILAGANVASQPRIRKILIVDDHAVMRQGLAKLLSDETDLQVCGEAENAPDALKAIGRLKPDLVIVDISLTGRTGIELIRDIRRDHPDVYVLVLSMHDETIYSDRALRAGARGYIMKQEGGKVVVEAIRKVLAGQVYLSEKMTAKFFDRISGGFRAADSPLEILSDREMEVFQLIGDGLTTRQIAEQLCLSMKTVEVHRDHIKRKLSLKDGTALVRYAIRWAETEKIA